MILYQEKYRAQIAGRGVEKIIGLVGAHRTGKTTLAKAWSEQTGMDFVEISTSKVIAEVSGGDCSGISSMDMRLRVQRRLVEACDRAFLRRRGAFISDRTPLDVAAYTLAEIRQNDMTPEQAEEAVNIVTDCLDIANSCFSYLVLVQPGIPYVVEPGKPPMNTAYQLLVHQLCMGLLADMSLRVPYGVMNKGTLSIEHRLDALHAVYARVTEDAEILSNAVEFLN